MESRVLSNKKSALQFNEAISILNARLDVCVYILTILKAQVLTQIELKNWMVGGQMLYAPDWEKHSVTSF